MRRRRRWRAAATCTVAAGLLLSCGAPTVGGPSAYGGSSRHEGRPGAYRGHQADMRRVPVKMYMAEWCPVCRQARAWLIDNGYRFTEYNVEQDRQAARTLAYLNPHGSIPTFDVDGQVLRGFEPRMLESMVSRAAHNRR